MYIHIYICLPGSKRGGTCAQPFHGKRVSFVGLQVIELTTERHYRNCRR